MAMTLRDLIQQGQTVTHRPWPRAVIDQALWTILSGQLAQGIWTLVSLWGESDQVHMALLDEANSEIAVFTCECPDGRFSSVGERHPPAIRLERAIRDLYGLEAEGAIDVRPWLDHDKWPNREPLSKAPRPAGERRGYPFLPVEGEGLHQIPVGPVHAGIIEPGHFRFTCNGETVVRLEERLGYAHKGIDALIRGVNLERAAHLAARISGDSTVAYGWAFAHAVEAATSTTVPTRAMFLRALMAELERLANHCGDIGAICNDATFTIMHAQCGMLREQVLRVADGCFGHRLMMDRIVPGGVTHDLAPSGIVAINVLLDSFKSRFPKLVELYDLTASVQDRTATTGTLKPTLVRQFGAGGYVGRASGRSFDARKAFRYAPYEKLEFDVPVRAEGDVNARIWIRIGEVMQSVSLVRQILRQLPPGEIVAKVNLPPELTGGSALIEGFRGDVFTSVRLDQEGMVAGHFRDPSWFQWPLLEAAVEGNIVADFPLCNKSFNCSYSGHDL